MTRRVLTIVHSRYGWYQEEYFETLCAAFDVRLVTVFDDLPDDPMPVSLVERTNRVSMGMAGVRVRHYSPRRLWRLLREVSSAAVGASAVLTSTQNPVHSKVAWVVARLRRIPVCVVVEQWQDYPDQGMAKGVYNRLSIALMRSAARCFVHGERARGFAERMGVSPDRIRRYPHMNADLGTGLAAQMPESAGVRFLYVGRFVEVKGLDVLIDAFARVHAAYPDTRLRLCGDGELRDSLEERSRQLGVDVEITGRVAPARLREAMSWCHVLVLPSRQLPDAYEGWGLVVGEAASLGRVLVVSSVVGSAPELVEEGVNGFVVPEGDANALAEALLRLAENPGDLPRMGLSSRSLWERYCDAGECVRLLEEVMQ